MPPFCAFAFRIIPGQEPQWGVQSNNLGGTRPEAAEGIAQLSSLRTGKLPLHPDWRPRSPSGGPQGVESLKSGPPFGTLDSA